MKLRIFARRTIVYLPFIGLLPFLPLCAESFDEDETPVYVDNIILTNETDSAITAVSFIQDARIENKKEYLPMGLKANFDQSTEINAHDSDTLHTQIYSDIPDEIYNAYVIVISSKTMKKYPIDEIIDSFIVDSCYQISGPDFRAKKHHLVYTGK